MKWIKQYKHHHGRAHEHVDQLDEKSSHQDVSAVVGRGIIRALLALVGVQFGAFIELRKLRIALEQQQAQTPVRLNLTGQYIPKDGGTPMPAGPFNPSDTQDVLLKVSPTNAAGQPVKPTVSWNTSNSASAAITPSADTQQCLVTCAPGIDLDAVVTATVGSLTDSASIKRTVGGGDQTPTTLGLTGELVDKPAAGAARV